MNALHITPEILENARKILENSAQTNRNLFIGFNFLVVIVLVLCLSVTDEMLLLIDSSALNLPLINVVLPVWAFAIIAPMVLVALHFDLLYNLREHRDKLKNWCDCWLYINPGKPGEVDMPKQLFPFFFDFAWLHVNIQTDVTRDRDLLIPSLCWLLYCWSGYTVLSIILMRFAELQDLGYTSWHTLLLIFDALILYWYWPGFSYNPDRSSFWQSFITNIIAISIIWLLTTSYIVIEFYFPYYLTAWRYVQWLIAILIVLLINKYYSYLIKWLDRMIASLVLAFSTMYAVWTLILLVLVQAHIDYRVSPNFINNIIDQQRKGSHTPWVNLLNVPRLSLSGFRLNLPNDFFTLAQLQYPKKNKNQLWQETHNALILSRRSLAFADLNGAHLPHCDLSNANLQGAKLVSADLQGTDLIGANMQGTDFRGANLQNSDISPASLQGADLQSAMLQGANLHSASLQGTNLELAKMQGTDLGGANMQGANFDSAELQGADLRYAKLQGADLEDAKLQGADIRNADLQGVFLINAQLYGLALSDNHQFESSWVDNLDWKISYDFTRIKDESLALPEIIQNRLENAKQRLKAFKPPQLPKSISKEAFIKVWLGLLCTDEDMTKGMLRRFNFYNPDETHPIDNSKAQVELYLDSQEHCTPYRTLLNRN